MLTDPIKEWTESNSTGLTDVHPGVRGKSLRLVELGCRLALAELAENKGQTVEAVAARPDLLEAAGLPGVLSGETVRAAHRLHRNAIDGCLWRANVGLPGRGMNGHRADWAPPELTGSEADELIALAASPAVVRPTPPNVRPTDSDAREAKPSVQAASARASTPKPSQPIPTRAAKPTIFGFSACRIVMWCGANGFGEAEAAKVLDHHGIQLSSSTVRNNVKSAATGKMGQPAVLTPEQAAQLTAIAKEA